MPAIGVTYPELKEQFLLEEALRRAVRNPYKYGDPATLLVAATPRRIEGVSVTELVTSAMRKSLLEKLLDYYVDLKTAWYAVRGKWVHHTFELGVKLFTDRIEGSTAEKRLQSQRIPDLSGQVDMYYGTGVYRLVDYKSSTRHPPNDCPRPEHEAQLNAYAALARENGYPVDDLALVSCTYGSQRVYQVQLWEDEEVWDLLERAHDFYTECLKKRAIPPRRDPDVNPNENPTSGYCNLRFCRFCPFLGICREHPGWWQVPEGVVMSREDGEVTPYED